jgi:hypothetical protein
MEVKRRISRKGVVEETLIGMLGLRERRIGIVKKRRTRAVVWVWH